MKYKKGDRVKVRNNLDVGNIYGNVHFVANMKNYIGKIVTIAKNIDGKYFIEEDDANWFWTDKMFESKLISLVQLSQRKNKPKQVKIQKKLYVYDEKLKNYIYDGGQYLASLHHNVLFNDFNKPLIEIVEEQILDEVEKEWLGKVLLDKNEITCIVKFDNEYNEYNVIQREFIRIYYKGDSTSFKSFKKGTMYKGMELNKQYTLEELGL